MSGAVGCSLTKLGAAGRCSEYWWYVQDVAWRSGRPRLPNPRRRPARATAKHDKARHDQGNSFPGFMIAAGSSSAFSARNAATPALPISRSNHGA
jgi:hypothetical protein